MEQLFWNRVISSSTVQNDSFSLLFGILCGKNINFHGDFFLEQKVIIVVNGGFEFRGEFSQAIEMGVGLTYNNDGVLSSGLVDINEGLACGYVFADFPGEFYV